MRKEFIDNWRSGVLAIGLYLALAIGLILGAAAILHRALAQQTSGVTNVAPLPTHGFGSLSISATTSTLLSTTTVGPNSTPWPLVPSLVYFINQTAGTCYVCPLAGTCGASGAPEGIWVLSGNAYGFFQMSTNATAYCASSGTVQAQW